MLLLSTVYKESDVLTETENKLLQIKQLRSDLFVIQNALSLIDEEKFIKQINQCLQELENKIKEIKNECLEAIPTMSICDTDWYSC